MSGGDARAPFWRSRRFWVWAGYVAAAGLIVAGLLASLHRQNTEVLVYTTGAERMAEGLEIYRPSDAKPFTYPPFFALPFMLLTGLSEEWQRALLFLMNVASLGLTLWILWRVARPVLREGATASKRSLAWFWIPTLLIGGRHVASAFETQSHDILVFLLIVIGVASASRLRDAGAGGFWGIAAACKATPLLFLPVVAAQRRLLATLALSVTVVTAVLLPDLLFPRLDGQMWVMAWINTFLGNIGPGAPAASQGAWSAHSVLNQNLAGMIFRLGTPVQPGTPGAFSFDVAIADVPPAALKAITIAAQLSVAAIIAWAAWPSRSRGLSPARLGWRRVGEAGTVVCGMVLLSPMSSKAHFCVLLLPTAFCVAEHFFHRPNKPAALLLAIALILGLGSTKGIVGRDLGNQLLGFGVVAWVTIAILLATALILVRSDDEGEAEAQAAGS